MTASVSVGTTTPTRTATSTDVDPGDASPRGDSLAGFGELLRFLGRRDRLRALIWLAAIVGLFSVSVASVVGLYETPSELRSYADLALADPAIKAFAGPGNGL
ncbi:MAG TPA: hypothetical protein VMW08_16810, partial [Acidimicrobiales bacterium]|nr:hypothetical protein [Acidimicrobiales bacterium]